MGAVISAPEAIRSWWWSRPSDMEGASGDDSDSSEAKIRNKSLSPAKAKELEEFKRQLAKKRELRKRIISEKSHEMQSLRQQLEDEKHLRAEVVNENKSLREVIAENNIELPNPTNIGLEVKDTVIAELEERLLRSKEENRSLKCEMSECYSTNNSLSADLALLNKENFELKKHVQSLKDVNRVSKEMMAIRETQLTQLKDKLVEIEKSLADREMKTLSNDLKKEYERQLENIRNLRVLYEERARVAEVTRINLVRDLEEQKNQTEEQLRKCTELETRVEELENEVTSKDDVLGKKENQLGLSKAETKNLQAEMTVINKLFTQMLLGYNATQDLDKLIEKLEENHDLLTDMVFREDCSEVASALPKLILELLNQVDTSESVKISNQNEESNDNIGDDTNDSKTLTSAKEIVDNLPKVWKVLMELLSHQSVPKVFISDNKIDKSTDSCYKSIETTAGPRMVPSISKTYIRLKDLILEKKSLQKEMGRMKQLNCHLENRLQDQERRLGLVSSELNKTWHIVGRMQRQHQQFHAQEQILRFELQQKRLLLKELREQLGFCKEKWDKAKEKNTQSQEEWDKLRLEFSSRKIQSIDNSAESGYSDEKGSDDDSINSEDESRAYNKRIKKKNKNTEEVISSEIREDIENENITNSNSNDIDIMEKPIENECQPEDSDMIPNVEVQICETASEEENDSKSINDDSSTECSSIKNYDDVLATRSARLKKLEEQCYVLVHKVTKTNNKGVELCNRLEELHNQYGGSSDEQQASTSNGTENINIDLKENENIFPINSTLSENNITNNNAENMLNVSENNVGESTIENQNQNTSIPSTSTKYDYESKFAARDARLKLMEEQAKTLVKKVTKTTNRGNEISTKLTELHNTYSQAENDSNELIGDVENKENAHLTSHSSSHSNSDKENQSTENQ